jgi:hypothetical protein
LAERPLIDLRIEDLLREFNRARRAHDARRLIELRDELVHAPRRAPWRSPRTCDRGRGGRAGVATRGASMSDLLTRSALRRALVVQTIAVGVMLVAMASVLTVALKG